MEHPTASLRGIGRSLLLFGLGSVESESELHIRVVLDGTSRDIGDDYTFRGRR